MRPEYACAYERYDVTVFLEMMKDKHYEINIMDF